MARLATQKVHSAFDKAAQHILEAAGNDPIVSRKKAFSFGTKAEPMMRGYLSNVGAIFPLS